MWRSRKASCADGDRRHASPTRSLTPHQRPGARTISDQYDSFLFIPFGDGLRAPAAAGLADGQETTWRMMAIAGARLLPVPPLRQVDQAGCGQVQHFVALGGLLVRRGGVRPQHESQQLPMTGVDGQHGGVRTITAGEPS